MNEKIKQNELSAILYIDVVVRAKKKRRKMDFCADIQHDFIDSTLPIYWIKNKQNEKIKENINKWIKNSNNKMENEQQQ